MPIQFDLKIDLLFEEKNSEGDLADFIKDLRQKFITLQDLGYSLVSKKGEVIDDFIVLLHLIELQPQLYLSGFNRVENLKFNKVIIDLQEIGFIFHLNEPQYRQIKESLKNSGIRQMSLPI